MNALHAALAQVRDRQGWAKVADVQRAHGPQAVEGLLARGYASVDRSDDTLVLTEAGARACRDLLSTGAQR